MDAKISTKTKTKTFQNLNKNCPLNCMLEVMPITYFFAMFVGIAQFILYLAQVYPAQPVIEHGQTLAN